MLAIAVPARREPPPGDGQHRRYKQRGEWLAPDSWWNLLKNSFLTFQGDCGIFWMFLAQRLLG